MWTIVLVVAGTYTALALILFLFQSRLLFHPNVPSRDLVATPERIGLAYEPVSLRTEDGVTLHAWFLPAAQERGVVLFFHGNAGNISHRLESLKVFHDLGLATLIIDYRGYGRSEGEVSEQGMYRDAEAAWRYLVDERAIPPQRIVVFGRSLGAAVAAYLASRTRPAALILESGFTSVPNMAAKLYPIFPARWLARFGFDSQAYLGSVTSPVLVVHSPDDEIIPFGEGRALFAAASEPKVFLQIRGGHNDGFLVSGRTYVDGLDSFLTQHLSQ